MRSLIRKEWIALLPLVAVAFVLLCLLMFGSRGSPITFIVPDDFLAELVFTIAAITGVVLGYLQFASERWLGKTAYLLHRGTGRSQVFAAKTIAGLGATLVLSIGPLVVFALARKYLYENGPLVRFDRVVEPACAGAFAVVAYGLGTLAAQIRRHPIAEILLVAVGGSGTVLFAESVLDSLPATVSAALALFVLAHVVLGAILLVLARRLFIDDVDRELALRPSPSSAMALLAVPLLVAPVLWVAVNVQGTLFARARSTDATILRDDADGSIFAVRPDRRGEFVRLDDRGEIDPAAPRLGSRDGGASYEMLYNRLEALRYRDGLRFPKAAWESVRDAYLRYMIAGMVPGETFGPDDGNLRVFLDRTHRVLRIYGFVERMPGSASSIRETPLELELGKPPGGTPFSDEVRILRGLARNRSKPFDFSEFVRGRIPEEERMHACIVDPADGSLWVLDLKGFPAALTPAALPGGDRFVRLESLYERRVREVGLRWLTGFDAVVHGEKGTYAWNGEMFVEFQPSAIHALEADVESRVGARAIVAATDPLATRIEIRSVGNDRALFAWNYEPRNPVERFCASLAQGVTLLRPPLANLVANVRPAPTEPVSFWHPSWILDPLLAGGRRIPLLVVSLAVGLVGALCTSRRLRRGGAAPSALAIWTLVVFLLGPIAFLAARLFEARRAPEPVVEPKAAMRRELLIESV